MRMKLGNRRVGRGCVEGVCVRTSVVKLRIPEVHSCDGQAYAPTLAHPLWIVGRV